MANAITSDDEDYERLSENSYSTNDSTVNKNHGREDTRECLGLQVSGLPLDVSEDEIYKTFQQYGKIVEHGVSIQHETNVIMINAIVQFTSANTVLDILKSVTPIFIRGFKLTMKMYNSKYDSNKAFDKPESNKQVAEHFERPSYHQEQTIEINPRRVVENITDRTPPLTYEPKRGILPLRTKAPQHRDADNIYGLSSNADNEQRKSNGPKSNENSTRNLENEYVESNVHNTRKWIDSANSSNIEHAAGIQIRNIKKLSSQKVLLQYVKSRRSNGGIVREFVFEKDYDHAVIVFENEDIAQKFFQKEDHTLEGQILYVSRLPPLCNNQFYFENIPNWVNLKTLEIYIEAKARCDIEQIQFRNDNKGAIICLSEERDAFDLQKKLVTKPLENDEQQKANIKLYPIVSPDAILVYGKIPSEDSLTLAIEDVLSEARMNHFEVHKVFPKVAKNMTVVIFKNYEAVSCFQNGTITVGDETFSVSPFYDCLGWIPHNNKSNFIRKHISDLVTKNLTELQLEFLSNPIGYDFIKDAIEKQKWEDCHFDVIKEKQILSLTASTKKLSENYAAFVLSCMKSIEINLDGPMSKLWNEKGSIIKEKRNEKDIKNWFCLTETEGKLSVLAASTEIERVKQLLTNFFDENSIYDESIVDNEMYGQHLRKYNKNDLKEKCSEKMSIKFTKNGQMLASGTRSQIEMFKFDVQVMLSDLEIAQYAVQRPGMSNHFRTASGLLEISNIAGKTKTIILNETEFSPKSERTVASINGVSLEGELNHNLKILVIHGDLTLQKVDTIVNAANEDLQHSGGLAAAIVEAGGQEIQIECRNYIKRKGPLSIGGLFVSHPGNLPCKKIIHVVGPRWQDGRSEEHLKLRNAITNCIDAANAEKFSSIAIPAVSTKVFGYPVEKAIPIIVDAIADACKTSKAVKEVRLVDMDQNTVKLFAQKVLSLNGFQQNKELSKAKVEHQIPQKPVSIIPVNFQPRNVAEKKIGKLTGLTFNGCTINVLIDDIVNVAKQSNVVINTTVNAILGGGASSTAITNAAGAAYVNDVKQKYPNGLTGGKIGKTTAGQLGCQFVYHIACPAWNAATGEQSLDNIIAACLTQLNSDKCTTIAFPAIGTGGLHYPAAIVAKVMFDSTIKWLKSNTAAQLQSIFFVVFPTDVVTVQQFENEYTTRTGGVGGSTLVQTAPSAACSAIKIGPITVEIIEGDIIKEKTDCIVCPSNDKLDLTQGQVAVALKTAGGQSFETMLQNDTSVFKKGVRPVFTKDVLPYKCVLFIDAPHENTYMWPTVFMQALKEASKSKLISLAVPALGTGELSRNVAEVADMMLQTIQTFASTKQGIHLKLIRIVIFQKLTYDQFCQHLSTLTAKLSTSNKSNSLLSNAWEWITKKVYSESDNNTIPVERRNVEKNLLLYICGPKASVQMAQSLLDKSCDEHCPERTISKDIISYLDQDMIAKLEMKAEEFNVKLFISREQNKIKIKGFHAIEFHNFLTDILNEINDEIADVVGVQWSRQKCGSTSWEVITLGVVRLERAYKMSSGKGCVSIEMGGHDNVSVDFDKMEVMSQQKNVLYNLKRVDLVAVQEQTPKEWNWDVKCLDEYKLVQLDPQSAQYIAVSNAVSLTAKVNIKQIQQIQNPVKYQQYMLLKRKMEQTLSKNFTAERNLFHGTDPKNIPGICTHGFNRSLFGSNGTVYGFGSYFARDFKYSQHPQYSHGSTVFYVKVLTGAFTQGAQGMKVAPDLDASKGTRYDSVVDNIVNPSIFVVFSDNHAYPEYLITFG